jgi:hypothetical protein
MEKMNEDHWSTKSNLVRHHVTFDDSDIGLYVHVQGEGVQNFTYKTIESFVIEKQ